MESKKIQTSQMHSKRRFSTWRLFLVMLILAGLAKGVAWGLNKFAEERLLSTSKPWFAPYVDVTATPLFAFEQPTHDGVNEKNVILSFIVSSKTDACTPTWGGTYNLEEANKELDLDRRIARYRQQEGNVAVSFGGLLNDELAINCKDPELLQNAYESVIAHYSIDTIDFDLEGGAIKDSESLKRRAEVVAKIQKKYRSENKNLAVWLTLPVTPQGLSEDGTKAVAAMLGGVDLAGVNVMTMDYGTSRSNNQSMKEASVNALNETHRQIGILFSQAGINLSDATLWFKIGATPMIGQNDIAGEIFTLEDAISLNEFLIAKGIARMSMWSANRDIQCGDNYVNVTMVSDSCSGVKQEANAYSDKLGQGFTGKISANSATTTEETPQSVQKPDNPEESPYPIWFEKGVYLTGTKVVWHHNVYQAKWWTSGELPDNPVLQSWQTPWQLVGPVLPGEKPIPQLKLPAGTYPNWDGTVIYDVGERVLFNDIPYQAKWWSQGDSPAASTSNPDSSPWILLSREEIEKILKEKSGD